MEPNYLNIEPRAPFIIYNAPKLYPDEIFVQVIYYDGTVIPQYYISNYGRLYSCYYNRILNPTVDDKGYYRTTIKVGDNKTSYTGMHKLEMNSFNPISNHDIFIVNHKDGNPQNNDLSNLECATISENTRHALDNGLSNCKGENCSTSIFTNDQVNEICKQLEDGKSVSDILDSMELPYGEERNRIAAVIRLIKRGKTYKDISCQYNIPGLQSDYRFSPEDTIKICDIINNKQTRLIDICDELNIPLEDRKMFYNHIDDIIKRRCDRYIIDRYDNLIRPSLEGISEEDMKYYV